MMVLLVCLIQFIFLSVFVGLGQAIITSTASSRNHSNTSTSGSHTIPVASSSPSSITRIATIYSSSSTTSVHVASSSTKISTIYSNIPPPSTHNLPVSSLSTSSISTILQASTTNRNISHAASKNSPLMSMSSIQTLNSGVHVKNQTDHSALLANSFAIPSSSDLQAHGNLAQANKNSAQTDRSSTPAQGVTDETNTSQETLGSRNSAQTTSGGDDSGSTSAQDTHQRSLGPTTATGTHETTTQCDFIQIMSSVHLNQDFGETVHKTVAAAADCSSDCDAETSFVCTAYMWAPPFGDCVMFDKINLNLQVFVDHGAYNLYDKSCNGETPLIGFCQFEITQSNIAVSGSGVSPGMASPSGCQGFCIADYTNRNCSAFTVAPAIQLYSTCTLFKFNSIKPADISAGTLDLWTIVCHTATGETQSTTTQAQQQTTSQQDQIIVERGSTQQGTTETDETDWAPWPSSTKKTPTKPAWYTTVRPHGTTTESNSKYPPWTQSGHMNETVNEEIGDVLHCSVQCVQYWFEKAKQLFSGDDSQIPMQQCDCNTFPFRSFSSENK